MSSHASAPDAPTRLRSAVEIACVSLGVLVAVGVAVLFLALTGASRTSSVPRPQSPRYVPLIQRRGEGLDQRATSPTQQTSEGTNRQ
jgi:hypothetical protein